MSSSTPAKEEATSDPAEAASAQAPAPHSPPAAAAAEADAPHDAATEDNKRPAAETETEADGEKAAPPAAALPAPSKKPRNAPAPPISATSEYVTEETTFLIPKASIKRIMKLDPDTKQLSQDAIMLMAKATELFVDKLAKASHAMAVANKRKTIKYEDIADARLSDKALEFLDGVVPQIP
jgi:histone H3/H4